MEIKAEYAELVSLLEALLLAYGEPLSIERMLSVFEEHQKPTLSQIKHALTLLAQSCQNRGFELKEVATGYRLQVASRFSEWVSRLWEEKPQRYSRALLETLALIAYRQPITRGEIEEVRGVAVNSQIIKTLQERDWIRVVGYKELPGKPAMLATTKTFLDYFNLKTLEELPSLTSIHLTEVSTISVPEDVGLATADMFDKHMFVEPVEKPIEKNFKLLLEEWDEMEQGVKIDFEDNVIKTDGQKT